MSTLKILREFARTIERDFGAKVTDVKHDSSAKHKLTIALPSGTTMMLTLPSSPRDADVCVEKMIRKVRHAVTHR